MFDLNNCQWIKWTDTTEKFSFSPEEDYQNIIVPTQDSIRYTFLLDLLMKNDLHVLFTGNTGTGKTVNIQQVSSDA